MKVKISQLEIYIPQNEVSNAQVEDRLRENGFNIPEGLLENTMGGDTRFYAEKHEQASDLAAKAGRKVLDKAEGVKIDLLIFASASSDLIEPATANIVQQKLGLQCAAFDMKNACNSVTNAIEVACSLISSGGYKNILIASGEKASDSIRFHDVNKDNFKSHFASYSFGDAGVALLLSPSPNGVGFFYHKHTSFGQHWRLSTIPGGGSLHPKDAEKLYFSGETFALKSVFDELCTPFVKKCLEEAEVSIEDIDLIVTHQVSKSTYEGVAENLGIDTNKIVKTFGKYGNTASSSLPIALHHALENNMAKSGDTILLLGMAAGVNISVQLMKV